MTFSSGTLTITGLEVGKDFSLNWLGYNYSSTDVSLSSSTGYTTVKSLPLSEASSSFRMKSVSNILTATNSTVTLSFTGLSYYSFSAYQV